MESFVWAPYYQTGIASVDQQHHHLVDVINRFGEVLLHPDGSAQAEIDKVFQELAAYAQTHFSDEERLMAEAGLDERMRSLHRHEHLQFLDEVGKLQSELVRKPGGDGSSLLNYLTNWLAYHILGSDHVMTMLMKAKAEGRSQDEAYRRYLASRDPATATLLQAVNRLFTQVSARNRELAELNQTLEARVALRTLELSQANKRLENMAMTDVLTQLPNRRHAMLTFELEWQSAVHNDTPLSCMMIDADGFKGINDTYGHDAGDEVLRQLARKLRETVRNDDIVCRLGGDEFFIICSHTDLEGAMVTAEKVRQQVDSLQVPVGKGFWKGSISVGVASRSAGMHSAEDLLKAADEGVYLAKKHGRNCVSTICPRNFAALADAAE